MTFPESVTISKGFNTTLSTYTGSVRITNFFSFERLICILNVQIYVLLNVFFKFGLNSLQTKMNKIYLVFLFISTVLYSQNIKPSLHAVKFEDSLHVNFTHFQANKITFDFSKPETPYSLYNPMLD
jgi:hypothetical protein